MERYGVNASRSRSEVTPREWFETKGSKPELREPPKRRHFATITVAAETRPFRPCAASIFQQKKRRVPREARLRLPWSVWADAHGFEFEFKDLGRPPRALFLQEMKKIVIPFWTLALGDNLPSFGEIKSDGVFTLD